MRRRSGALPKAPIAKRKRQTIAAGGSRDNADDNTVYYEVILPDDQPVIMRTSRQARTGGKLFLNGFSYMYNNITADRTYWLCSKNRYGKCKARLVTTGANNDVIVRSNLLHNHEAEHDV